MIRLARKPKCEYWNCKYKAKFFVNQAVMPQTLGTGEMETQPAGRSVLSCGSHLSIHVLQLGSLPYRINEPVKVQILESEK